MVSRLEAAKREEIFNAPNWRRLLPVFRPFRSRLSVLSRPNDGAWFAQSSGRWLCGLTLLAALASGCGEEEPEPPAEPEDALRLFVSAAYFGDGKHTLEMLSPDLQKDLETRAKAANKAAGGEVVSAQDLLISSGFVSPMRVTRYERVEVSDTDATYKLHIAGGAVWPVSLKRIDNVWRVDGLSIVKAVAPDEPSADTDKMPPTPAPEPGAAPADGEDKPATDAPAPPEGDGAQPGDALKKTETP